MRTLPIAALAATLAVAGCNAPRPSDHLPAVNAVGPYSAAVRAGATIYLSGKIGQPGADFKTEVASAIDVVEADLARLGLTLADVVSVNVFVTDMGQFAELNEVYAARFPQPYPARTTVAVTALPKGAHVELQAVARSH